MAGWATSRCSLGTPMILYRLKSSIVIRQLWLAAVSITTLRKASLNSFTKSLSLSFNIRPAFVDPELMEDRLSSVTTNTTRRDDFRQRILYRDGSCVFDWGSFERSGVSLFSMQREMRCVLNITWVIPISHASQGRDQRYEERNPSVFWFTPRIWRFCDITFLCVS